MAKAGKKHMIAFFLNKIDNGEWLVKEGEIYKVLKGNKLKQLGCFGKEGYRTIQTRVNKVRYKVYEHRLLYAYYHGLDALDNDLVINHIDGKTSNNRKENLEQITNGANIQHYYNLKLAKSDEEIILSPRSKFTLDMAKEAKALLAAGETMADIARHLGVSAGSVKHIATGKSFDYIDIHGVETPEIKRMPKRIPPAFRGEKSGKAKLTEKEVIEIRSKYESGISTKKLTELYNIGKSSVWNIVARKTWTHI